MPDAPRGPAASFARRGGRGALLLAFVPPAALFVFVLWTLHHPNPRVIAPVPIDRNTLLPHQYAGPCLNCHRIIENGPVAINAGNMSAFSLSQVDRQLLIAGQRVDVPSLSQRLRIPAITRIQNLTHPYVGVCSNCHVVLDVHPSPEFMSAAMRNARQPLLGANMDPSRTARGGAIWDETRSRLRFTFGYVALLALLTVVGTAIAKRVRQSRRDDEAEAAEDTEPAIAGLRAVHAWSGAAFCVAATLHWYYSDRGNNLLHLALLLLSGLVAVGLLLRHRVVHEDVSGSRIPRFVHLVGAVGFITLLGLGHLLAGFS